MLKDVDAFIELWRDLVAAMLAVNNFSLEKAFGLLSSMEQDVLLDPAKLATCSITEVISGLVSAGYDRGAFMNNLMAHRLCGLGEAISTRGISDCEQILGGKDEEEISALLLSIHGIGPVVVDNFLLLRGIR